MGKKTLIKLIIILSVVGVIALAMKFFKSDYKTIKNISSDEKTKVFPDFKINEVTSIEVIDEDKVININKGKKKWEIKQRENFPASESLVNTLLMKVWDLTITQIIPIGRSQYGRLGLLSPDNKEARDNEKAIVVKFKNSGNKELGELWIGKIHEVEGTTPDPFSGNLRKEEVGRYVKSNLSNSVYLVDEVFSNFSSSPLNWISHDFISIKGIKSIERTSEYKKEDWKVHRDSIGGEFILLGANDKEILDNTKTTSFNDAFYNVQFTDVYTSEKLKDLKIDKVIFNITTFDGFTYNISIGDKSDLNDYPVLVKVDAKFADKRVVGKDEKKEDKEKLDKQFEKELKSLKEKFSNEKEFSNLVFKIRSNYIDALNKKRSELIKDLKKLKGNEKKSKK